MFSSFFLQLYNISVHYLTVATSHLRASYISVLRQMIPAICTYISAHVYRYTHTEKAEAQWTAEVNPSYTMSYI